MRSFAKISLSIPGSKRQDARFSFSLKGQVYNEQSEYNCPGKIFVISDIEGNFSSFCDLLYRAGVIDESFKWTFEDNHVVIAGDCFDRGDEVTECLWLIYSLEEKARKKGGYVHFILGNHEIMNMNGDWRYLHPKYAQRRNGSITALYDGNNELWRWLRTKNIIEKIGDILFVHGGISNEILQLGLSVQQINELARPWYARANEAFADPFLFLVFNSDTSPFWYRGYYQGIATEELINDTLKHFEVKTIVTGHTTIDHVETFFNGKVLNVNTNHASGNSEGLLIRGNKYYRIGIDSGRERIK